MSSSRVLVSMAALIFLAPLCAGHAEEAGTMTLELEAGVGTVSPCQYLHNVNTCVSYHSETSSTLLPGASLQLDGELYTLVWMGPAYHLDDGTILEPLGDPAASLKGQRWIEVHPEPGKIYRSRGWRDRDRNKALSSSDTLIVDGRSRQIKDVRLHLRVRPEAPRRDRPAPEQQ
jgi:hypothetical protein